MTVFERTWEWKSGDDIGIAGTNFQYLMKCGHMVGLKRALVGDFYSWTAPWTIAGSGGSGSGGGGGMDGVDRWGSSYSNASVTGNWMCLRGPNGTAFANIYLTLIKSGTGDPYVRWVVTDTVPTGGGQTTPPTFSGKIIDADLNSVGYYDGTARPYMISVGMTTQGGWYALFTDGSGHNWPTTVWGLLETKDGKTGDLPCCLLVGAPGASTQGLSLTANLCRMYHNNGTTVTVQAMAPWYASSAVLTSYYQDDWEAGFPTPDFPVFLWASTTSKQAFRGRLIDVYWGSDLTLQNTVEPSTGPPYDSVKFGAFWWPGATTQVRLV
jgi:hypothetical protein